MHRPPRTALLDLLAAANACDRDLDTALSDLGVLPPLDLTPIRHVLARPGVELALARNADGHVVIEVVEVAGGSITTALIHHDGRVHVVTAAA